MVQADGATQRFKAVAGGEARCRRQNIKLNNTDEVTLDENTCGLAARVAFDLDPVRRWFGIAVDAVQLQAKRIQCRMTRRLTPITARARQVNWMIGRYGIQFVTSRHALFSQADRPTKIIGGFADRHGDDPLTFWGRPCKFPNTAQDLIYRARAREGRTKGPQPLCGDMSMGIVKAGNDRRAGEVMDLGAAAAGLHYFGTPPHIQHLAVSHGNSLGAGGAIVKNQYVPD